jgi:hypothetical protein
MKRRLLLAIFLLLPAALFAAQITLVGPIAPKVTISGSTNMPTISVIGGKPLELKIYNPAATTANVVIPGLPGPPGKDGKDGTSGASSWNDIAGKPASFPPSAHNQDISTVTGLQTALDGKQAALGYTPVNTTDSRLSDARTPLAHTQDMSTVTGLSTALTGKTDLSTFSGYTSQQRALVTDPRFVDSRTPLPHNQGIETITGLQTVLDGKQPALGYTPVNTTDSRLSDARTPLAHNQATSTITGLDTALSAASSHIGNSSNPHSTTASQTGAEPSLGAPDTDGKVLSSTAMGVRLWVAPGAETRSTIVAKMNETPANDTLPLQYKKADGTDVFNIDPATGTVTITGTLVIK